MPRLAAFGFRPGRSWSEMLVRKKGLEPLRPFGHQLLRLARLPIPPLPHWTYRCDDDSVTVLRPLRRASSFTDASARSASATML